MRIELKEITIRDISTGYVNSDEEGVIGYNGRLNIRPAYQTEYRYKDKNRDAVIASIRGHFPLGVMYWSKSGENSYEMIDGQQRTLSICEFVTGKYSINFQYFHTLTKEEQDVILDYRLLVYVCEGTDRERLDWFRVINTAGVALNEQELRNAAYTGQWLLDAKRWFSKSNCQAKNIADGYITGIPERQDYLETAIDWISRGNIEAYMAGHQNEPNANELWLYFNNVITWVKTVFPNYRKEMKGVAWGELYDAHHTKALDQAAIERKVVRLMQDEDVDKKSGIYDYVLSSNERVLHIRTFTQNQKREAYERQNGICPTCPGGTNKYDIEEMEGDHITPWSQGGKTVAENCQMLCKSCNRLKGGR